VLGPQFLPLPHTHTPLQHLGWGSSGDRQQEVARTLPLELAPPALHVDIKWFFRCALSVAYWYDSMAFLEMFPWRHRTQSSFVARYSSLSINKNLPG
jgi:hypothetical protein